MDYLILVYPDGTPVGLDNFSGGYPVRSTRLIRTYTWRSEEERERYLKMFEKEGFKKATLRVEVVDIQEN